MVLCRTRNLGYTVGVVSYVFLHLLYQGDVGQGDAICLQKLSQLTTSAMKPSVYSPPREHHRSTVGRIRERRTDFLPNLLHRMQAQRSAEAHLFSSLCGVMERRKRVTD